MVAERLKGLLISDFNIANLCSFLRNDCQPPAIDCEIAPYGQVAQSLLAIAAAGSRPELDFLVVWSRPEAVLEGVARALSGHTVDSGSVLAEVDSFCNTVIDARHCARTIFAPTWILPPLHHGHGMLDLAPGVGVARLLMQANLRLIENLEIHSNIFPLNASKWAELAGEKAFNSRLWYMGKVPFGNELLKASARDIRAALRGVQGRARKVVIVDLDETLWGGVVGDVGWQNLALGGHDSVGEALVDFQLELKALARRGVILGIVSKNDEIVALEAIREHPAMALRDVDFAGWRINWQDKAGNILELATELNVGLDAIVFIDDNPVERARVRETLPDVLVPDWPEDKRFYPQALRSLDCFDKPGISEEDRNRQQSYSTDRERAQLKAQLSSVDEWLHTLDLRVNVETLNSNNIRRIAQLLNKTNQMNLTTRRLTEQELLAWAAAANRKIWGLSVADRFGDSGLTGILSLETNDGVAQIVDFVLSCRVMGRKIEQGMLHLAVNWARSVGAREVRATYLETKKNRPCREFFEHSGMEIAGGNEFVWSTGSFPLHPAVRLVGGEADLQLAF